jgi:predicted phosphodiesterase
MKIRVLSDLHLEFDVWTPPAADADVVVLAGDIHIGARGLEWAREQFPSLPIIYVIGNHEFYGGQMQQVSAALRAAAQSLDIHLLDTGELVLDGTRFLGATLWTDFALYGTGPRLLSSMNDARRAISDFRMIRHGPTGILRPEDAREMHLVQAKWLEGKLAEDFDGPTVVVTHFLPHRRSIHPKYEGDEFNPAFASDLAHLVAPPVTLWIHGHTHESFDYVVNGTRVVCNPRGYLPIEPNPAFDPLFVVDTDARGAVE